MENRNVYVELARKTLSEKRFIHSLNVAEMCEKLAVVYGVDREKAYTAGILHDIRRESNNALLLDEAMRSNLSPDPVELETPKLLHALSGAYYIKEHLGIVDEDVILAIRFHTVGGSKITKLQKLLYLSDLVSMERKYEDVEKYRDLTFEDMEFAYFEAIKLHIQDKMDRNLKIPQYTLAAYNEGVQLIKDKKEKENGKCRI